MSETDNNNTPIESHLESSDQPSKAELQKFKVIFIGDQSVGKSCILNRFMTDSFKEDYQATIGVDFQSKNIQVGGQEVSLLLYDTAGQEKFRSMIPMYIRGANIILLVYDISKKDSFNHIPEWVKSLTNINSEEVIFFVVANKIDLEEQREVTKEEGEKYAEQEGYIFQEVSAKSGDGFNELFFNKLPLAINQKFGSNAKPVEDQGNVKLDENEENIREVKKKRRCCK